MSKTLDQIYITNPATTILNDDLFYLSRSPYTAGHDYGITGANLIANTLTGAVLLNPTTDQTILNNHNLIMQTGSMVAPTMTPGNLSLSANSIISTNTNGAIDLVPNGSGATQGIVKLGMTSNIYADTSSVLQLSAIGKAGAFRFQTYWNANAGSVIYLGTSTSQIPGTLGAVTNNQLLSLINSQGDDGVTGLVTGSQIVTRTSGTISSGVVPAQIEFYTTNTSGVSTLGMTLTNAQVLNLAHALTVANGGSGRATGTAYALVASGTTSTGAQQSLTTGTSGQILTSGGSSSLPSWVSAVGSGSPALSTDSTYTPGFSFGGGSTGITYGVQVGNYSRVGNVVTVAVAVTLSSKGSSTGTWTMNLPVTSRATGQPQATPIAISQQVTFTGALGLSIGSASTTATFYQYASASNYASLSDTAVANNSQIYTSFSYLV